MARLEPSGKVVRAAVAEDGVVQSLLVAEGDSVKAGDPIAYLASRALRLEDVRSAELRVERGRLGALQMDAQSARVRLSEAEAVQYNADVERQKGLVEAGLVPGKQLDATRLLARRAEEQASAARADLKYLEGSNALNAQDARNELVRARILLERTTVVAPVSGTVLRVLARPGERAPDGVAQIGAVSDMTALAEVHANDVHLVSVGQRATFTSAALPGPVEGRVSRIGALVGKNNVFGEDPTAPDNARVVQVTVTLDDSVSAARFTNLEGQVKILLQSDR
ncbi:MAG: HlyD family efflux transporter periplasmic adaptor subunit [Vicinamibacteria bacterium]|nr:HlyD family efflux transporter periplasmic adaptor subunit [Vicinamibacteria bacterium]